MDPRTALHDLHLSLKDFVTLIGRAAPESLLMEYEGVVASLAPEAPQRSFFNAVAYDRLEHLQAAYAELDRRYVRAGVSTWTVWLMPGEDATAQYLQQRGHHLDLAPTAMARDLKDLHVDPAIKIDWALTHNIGTVAAINEEAYEMTGSSFRAALRRVDTPHARFYIARVAGEPVSSVMTLDHGTNTGLYCVATLPAVRAQGLSSHLMSLVLAEARERGCTTATVQAMPMGYTVFRKLGFQDLGKMAMWELRR